ncbi:exocyst complex component EXO70I-like [Magnolia sinica]|uniref:exocyst complex component EXO70I-like n=1 Tax=Magnolia sinica TaxID=86752 RepID=UPI002659045F|nr:exocyst complex component EXO70I-like [Magnolia sinica]
MEEANVESPMLSKLQDATRNLHHILQTSSAMQTNLINMDKRFQVLMETLSTTSKIITPIQSQSMTTKALDTRINRAVSPALKLLESFKITESLQRQLLHLSSKLPTKETPDKRLRCLLKYVDCVDRLTSSINSITQDSEPAIQKLQEAVEFLSRTKATDQYRSQRLRETLVTLKALYETEVDAMRYEGLLDEALLKLQDEYESILLQLRHKNIGQLPIEEMEMDGLDLGSDVEVEVLRRISETLARNDCLDICIDIFVKVRYRRAAKALMRLNPDYLKTYTIEEIDEMEWEILETVVSLWIQHFELAVKTVFVSEKKLCKQLLSGIMDGLIWAECFVKIADKIMAVFFRFGEGVARSSKEPQKLFKLLDMFDSMEKLKVHVSDIFEGEAGTDICTRFRELEKLLVHASCKVFWEFGLQIEGNQDGLPPPQDGSVLKLVRYAVNYLKYLATENYSASMAKVLRTEQIWKAGILSRPETDENLLKEAISNVMEALQRNIEAKKSRYRDKVLPHIFAMNTYWYIYMRTRSSELGKILGEQWMKKQYKTLAEESAYSYQKQAWGPLVRILERNDSNEMNKEAMEALARGKLEAFMKGIDENIQKHGSCYNIPDNDLREQIKVAIVNLVVTTYAGFLRSCSAVLPVKSFLAPDSIGELLEQLFDGNGKVIEGRPLVSDGKPAVRRREFKRRGNSSMSSIGGSNEMKDFQLWNPHEQ